MPNLLSKQILLLNKFNETSSCSEIRPWSKLASTLKNKAGQIVCQILSSNVKEQKPRNIPFLLPCRCHLMCQHLFPLPFILDMMCQKMIKCVKYWYMMCHRLIKCVKNFLFCTSLCKALAWMLLPKFTLGPIWASPYGWRVFQFFTSAKWSIVVFTWNIYSNPCDLFNLYRLEFLATLSSLHVAMQKNTQLNKAFL